MARHICSQPSETQPQPNWKDETRHAAQESTGESYLLDGRNSDDEEEREPARHWTCGCVDDQLWGQEPGSHLENTPSPTPASTYRKHSAGALLALQPGQEGHRPVLVTIRLRKTPWLRGVVKEAVSARGEGTHVTLDTLVHLVHSAGAILELVLTEPMLGRLYSRL